MAANDSVEWQPTTAWNDKCRPRPGNNLTAALIRKKRWRSGAALALTVRPFSVITRAFYCETQ